MKRGMLGALVALLALAAVELTGARANAAEPQLVALGAGWHLPRFATPHHSPLEAGQAGLPYGLHGSGPALAALDAFPPGVTVPKAHDGFSLKFHGGPIQPTTTSYAIYWDPPSAIMEPNYSRLIDRFLNDSGRSALYEMLTQYEGSNGAVLAHSAFGGSLVDRDPIPDPLTQATIFKEVETVLAQFDFTPGLGDEIFLVLPHAALPANGYCAYHGGLGYRGHKLTLAMIPYADAAGCGEDYDFQSPNRDLIADGGVAEVSTAQVGMVTDPLLDGWYDDKHGEVGDLCFEDFGVGIDNRYGDLIVSHGGVVDSYDVPEAYSNAAAGCAPAL